MLSQLSEYPVTYPPNHEAGQERTYLVRVEHFPCAASDKDVGHAHEEQALTDSQA